MRWTDMLDYCVRVVVLSELGDKAGIGTGNIVIFSKFG